MNETITKSVIEYENGIEDHVENGATVRKSTVSLSYFSTGQAARELGISTLKIRTLCETEAINAELTHGGQWRVPVVEVNRLKRDGIPSVPRRLPAEPIHDCDQREGGNVTKRSEPPALSTALTAAAEEVEVLRIQAEALAVRKQVEEELDWFRDRARKGQAEQQARNDATRHATEQANRERQRAVWLQSWLERALKLVPHDAPADAMQRVQAAVIDALASVRTDESARVIEPVIKRIVDCILQPWRLQQRIHNVIRQAVSIMPPEVQASGNPWHARAICAAVESLQPNDATTFDALQAAANAAVHKVRVEYEQFEARRRLVDDIVAKRRFPPFFDTRIAREAGFAVIVDMKPGTPIVELRAAVERAIAPEVARIQSHLEAERRERLAREVEYKFHRMESKGKEAALATIRAAIARHPGGTSPEALIVARDQVVRRLLAECDKREEVARLADGALEGLYPYLVRLADKYEFEGSLWSVREELLPVVRESLIESLTGSETPEDASKLMRRTVKQKLRSCY